LARTRTGRAIRAAFLLLGALGLHHPRILAQDTVPRVQRITLPEALQRVEQSSLDLRLAREAVAAARARGVTAGTRPNPTLGLEREQLGGDGGYHETVLTVGQSLDVTGQRQARREVAGREVAAAEARLATETARVRAEVRVAYLRAAGAEARLAVLSDAVLVFRDAERAGQSRYREGDISAYELQRLQVETARYETLLANARLEQLLAGRELAALTFFESGREGLVVLPADSLGSLLGSATVFAADSALARARRRADVRAAEADVQAARAQVALGGRGRRFNPTVTAGIKEQAGGMYGGVLGISVPLPLSDRNQGPIAEAEAALAQAETRLALTVRAAETDVLRALDRQRSLADRLTLREGLLARTGTLLRSARVSYAEGEMTLLELLDAAETYRTAREQADALLADYLLSVADVQRAIGGLDR
jgi:cobalt-zinc-cadmium efflux system outer membrane protein